MSQERTPPDDIRKPTALEEVYREIFDEKTGLVARQETTEKQLEPLVNFWEAVRWPARIFLGALGVYLTAQFVKLLEAVIPLLGGGK